MTQAQLDAILKVYGGKAGKDGWNALPEGASMTMHVARDGAAVTLARLEAVKVDGDLVFGRTPKKELYAARLEDVVAMSFDPGSSQPARRAGF